MASSAIAQRCEPHEYDATKCLRKVDQYTVKRVFPFSEKTVFAYEFVNDCPESLRILATFNSGHKNISAKISAKSDGEYDRGRGRGKIVCDGENTCDRMERFIACSPRDVQHPASPSSQASPVAAIREPVIPPREPAPKESVGISKETVVVGKNEEAVTTAPSIAAAPVIRVPTSTPSPPKPRFTMRTNWDLIGTDLKALNGVGLDECREACSADAACSGYTADRWNRFCFLKGSAVSLRMEPKATSGWKEGLNPSSSGAARIIEPYRKRKFSGNQIDSRVIETVGLCQATCFEAEQCVGFSFFISSRQCVRFSLIDNHIAEDNIVSGAKRQAEPTVR
jgi:hypothetical protein